MAQILHPDLILLDLSMPGMNGLDAARVLNRVMPEVPLIMYSAYSDSFTENEAGPRIGDLILSTKIVRMSSSRVNVNSPNLVIRFEEHVSNLVPLALTPQKWNENCNHAYSRDRASQRVDRGENL